MQLTSRMRELFKLFKMGIDQYYSHNVGKQEEDDVEDGTMHVIND